MNADDFVGGHSILALERFMDETRHMIIFDVLSWKSPVGEKGERLRLFLSDVGYAKAQASEKRGEIKIRRPSPLLERPSASPASWCCGRSKSPSRITSARKSRKGAKAMSELTYTRSGDYLIPDLSLTEQPQAPLGKYGRMRKDYLKEHRPVLWNSLLLSEKLYPHLREIDEAANNRLEQMMPELMKSAGVTEALKASDPMKWVGLMNTLKAQAEETILTELVFS